MVVRRWLLPLVVAGFCAAFVACASSDEAPASSGPTPAPSSSATSGDRDASAPVIDGAAPVDATPPPPARADVPAIACVDTSSDVYVDPPGLPAMTMALRGSIVRCAKDGPLSATDITSKLSAQSVTGITPTSETTVYRIAYRTYRDDGVAGISTARVYLPTKPRSLPLPVVAVAHPTVGLADGCTPSLDPSSLSDVALPWAARGFAVVAPDYAGLGNDGVQGYAANHDTAHSLLDGARALRAMLAPAALDTRVLLAGYSQGGGAVLASQALAGSYGAGGDVVAAIVFAPQFFSRINSFGYETMLRSPTQLTITTGISKPVVAAFRAYSIAYNLLGAADAGVTFPSDSRSGMMQAITTLCQTPFGGYVQGVALHVGDLFDETYRTSMLACIDGTPGCTGPASQVYAWLTADLVTPDPQGAPVLYIQGLADTIMPPAEEAACNLALMKSVGVTVQTCTDLPALHTNVVPRNVAMAVTWGEAKLDGQAPPTCSADGMPACQP
jgi:dienelactone hydrolase